MLTLPPGFAQAVLPDLTLGLLPAGTRAVLEVSPPWEQAGGGGPEAAAAASDFGGAGGRMDAMAGVAMGAATAASFGWVSPAGGGPGSGPKAVPPPRTFAEVRSCYGSYRMPAFAVGRVLSALSTSAVPLCKRGDCRFHGRCKEVIATHRIVGAHCTGCSQSMPVFTGPTYCT